MTEPPEDVVVDQLAVPFVHSALRKVPLEGLSASNPPKRERGSEVHSASGEAT